MTIKEFLDEYAASDAYMEIPIVGLSRWSLNHSRRDEYARCPIESLADGQPFTLERSARKLGLSFTDRELLAHWADTGKWNVCML